MLAVSFIPQYVNAASQTTYNEISEELHIKTLSTKSVKVKWKKHKADKYIIYKVITDKKGNTKKKIKTVSGKKTSAVIKAGKNEFLQIHVRGIRKTKTSMIRYDGDVFGWTGVATPQWDDYLYAEGYCSPSSITIQFNTEGGFAPIGYQIYRKAKGASSYKKIKTLKTKKKTVTWKDKTVKNDKSYYYKVRAFSKKGKRTYYSNKSDRFLRHAVNFNGKYAISSNASGENITIKIKSNKNNGVTVFSMISLYNHYFPTEDSSVCYIVKAYSLDGSEWVNVKNYK